MLRTPIPVGAAVAVIALATGAGCGREVGFPDRTARVDLDGRTTTFAVDACLLDGRTAYVVGRDDDGQVVQAVVGVEADGATGVPASSGITVTSADGDEAVAAFGEEAWARRGREGEPPGTVASARIRGSRVQLEGRVQPTDEQDRPQPGPEVALSFDSRCDEADGG